MDDHLTSTDEGKEMMLKFLGIKTDLDWRASAVGRISASPLGENAVEFALLPCIAYAEFYWADNADQNRDIFWFLTHRENYPIYLHCWAGADRTGNIIMLLKGILGIDDEDLLLDYELTSLGVYGVRSRNGDYLTEMIAAAEAYGGTASSWSERAERYLLAIGITLEEIENLRDFFLE